MKPYIAAAITLFASSAFSADVITTKQLSHELATTIAQTAVDSCVKMGYQVSAVVVDRSATPQVLIIVAGVGYYQERGKEPILMKVGDVIKCDKDTEHWHASSKENDASLLEKIRELRSTGERVVSELTGQTGGADEAGCDRILVFSEGQWIVQDNK